jgi:hypothetical protein
MVPPPLFGRVDSLPDGLEPPVLDDAALERAYSALESSVHQVQRAVDRGGPNSAQLFLNVIEYLGAHSEDDAENSLRILRTLGTERALYGAWAEAVIRGLDDLLRGAKRYRYTSAKHYVAQEQRINECLALVDARAAVDLAHVTADAVFDARPTDARAASAVQYPQISLYFEDVLGSLEAHEMLVDKAEAVERAWRLLAPSDTEVAHDIALLKSEHGSDESALRQAVAKLVSTGKASRNDPSRKDPMTPEIFVSHVTEDKPFAQALVDLMLEARVASTRGIRCTSLEGFQFDAGESWERALRREVTSARVVIGLISRSSPHSQWVLFELGARWGAGADRDEDRSLVPVLVEDARLEDLPAALPRLQACRGSDATEVEDLVYRLGELLGTPIEQDRATRNRLRSAAARFAALSASE